MALRKGKIVEAAGVQGCRGEFLNIRPQLPKISSFSPAPLHPCPSAILTPLTLQLNLVPFQPAPLMYRLAPLMYRPAPLLHRPASLLYRLAPLMYRPAT
ncbi:hypothetical protein [Nostoc sp. 'Peltigera membranacea cyanobiont' 232]|uniref:hypothetical protein n=1 Tax=Nostoc sp. 'Peltigera membranacea cyanobiont' 232 TaxID=2014531 RepID=UPI00117D478B|nr:hypothetical protein [Nostoc sp. 'Peltigera membranacea cyanobiont' 232]